MNEHNRDYDYIGAPYISVPMKHLCTSKPYSTVWKATIKNSRTPNYDHSNESTVRFAMIKILHCGKENIRFHI